MLFSILSTESFLTFLSECFSWEFSPDPCLRRGETVYRLLLHQLHYRLSVDVIGICSRNALRSQSLGRCWMILKEDLYYTYIPLPSSFSFSFLSQVPGKEEGLCRMRLITQEFSDHRSDLSGNSCSFVNTPVFLSVHLWSFVATAAHHATTCHGVCVFSWDSMGF